MASAEKMWNAIMDWRERLTEDHPLIAVEGRLYYYADGHWQVGIESHHQFRAMFQKACTKQGFMFADKERTLWSTLRDDNPQDVAFDAEPLLACRNGVVDLETGKVYKHDQELYVTRYVDVEYQPKAKCPEFLKALDRSLADVSGDQRKEVVQLLAEFFGVSMTSKRMLPRHLKQGMLVYGPSGTGKSSVSDVLAEFFPRSRICTSTVRQMSGRFGMSDLLNRLAWIANEALDGREQTNAGMLKRILDGDELTVEQKYIQAAKYSFEGAVCFTANSALRVDEDSDAVFNRLLPLKFTRIFTAEDARRDFGKSGRLMPHLRDANEMPGVLNWALAGGRMARDNGRYTHSTMVEDLRREMRTGSSPLADFLYKACEEDQKVVNTAEVVAKLASLWAEREHGQRLVSNAQLSRAISMEIRTVFPGVHIGGRATVNGRQGAVYKGLKLNGLGQALFAEAQKDGDFIMAGKVEINRSAL